MGEPPKVPLLPALGTSSFWSLAAVILDRNSVQSDLPGVHNLPLLSSIHDFSEQKSRPLGVYALTRGPPKIPFSLGRCSVDVW